MIYCPNKVERFTSALRLFYQKLILENGIKKNFLKSLRKIYVVEAINNSCTIRPYNIENLCGELLTAVFLKKSFDYKITTKQTYMFDKKCFIALLLSICRRTKYLEIADINKSLVLKGNFKVNKTILKLIKKQNGNVFKEYKSKMVYISFNFKQTKKKSEDFETAYMLLENPLSVINIYFN